MNILVTFALEAEFAPWRRRREFQPVHYGGLPAWAAPLGSAELRVVLTGMGPRHAARSLGVILADRPDFIVASGLAGALRPQHRPGDVLVARAVSSSGTPKTLLSDESLYQFAAASGARPVDLFRSSDALVRTPAEKALLAPLAHAVDMESYAVLEQAAAHRIPAVAIRSISDSCDQSLPYDFSRMVNSAGRLSLPRLLGHIARRPHRLPRLLSLGRTSRAAAGSVADFLDHFLTAWVACTSSFDRPCEVAAT